MSKQTGPNVWRDYYTDETVESPTCPGETYQPAYNPARINPATAEYDSYSTGSEEWRNAANETMREAAGDMWRNPNRF